MTSNITSQEMFNKVWERAKIPVKSMGSTGCAYRNEDGSENHCFIGVCILDEDYNPCMEGLRASDSPIRELFPECNEELMTRLQVIHDGYQPGLWESELRSVANTYNLSIPA